MTPALDPMPCPFCGCKRPPQVGYVAGFRAYQAQCPDCHASVWRVGGSACQTAEMALSAWNTRADLAASGALQQAAQLAFSEAESRLQRQVQAGGLNGIALVHGQVSEAMRTLGNAILALASEVRK